jgi:hypothetical protein
MKSITPLFIALSLGLNVTLGYFALTGSARVSDEVAAEAAAAQAAAEARRTARPTGAEAVDPKTWAALESPDLKDLAARLNAAGFPKDVIRAIIVGLISEQFAARRKALEAGDAKNAFWKDQSRDLKYQLAQYQLYREQDKAVRAVLGDDAYSDPLTLAYQRSQYGFLPPEKMSAIQAIQRENSEKQTELYYKKGTMNMDDMRAIEKDLRTSLAAVLTPAELEEYDLRNSNTGRTLRNELLAFNPSEEEYRAIFKLRQPFDEQYAYTNFTTQEQMQRRSEAEKQLKDQVSALLGAERGAEYARTTDYSYRQTAQLVARLEMPPETTGNLWNVQKEFAEKRTELIRNASSLTPEERTKQLTQLQQEAIARITPILGTSSRVEAYKQYGGSWLANMVPQPRPATPAAPKE